MDGAGRGVRRGEGGESLIGMYDTNKAKQNKKILKKKVGKIKKDLI